MAQVRSVAAFVGSLRKESFTGKTAKALIALAPPSLEIGIVEIGHLSPYNQDLDTGRPPADWAAFRQRIQAADGPVRDAGI